MRHWITSFRLLTTGAIYPGVAHCQRNPMRKKSSQPSAVLQRQIRSRCVPFRSIFREGDMPPRSSKALAVVAVALCLCAPAAIYAQDFPSRVIRVVVAFPAGGPTDFVARLVADKLKPLLGQNVIVENKPGANGAIGADYVAKGEADGHLLFLTTVGAVAITPHLSKPNYDTLRDFAPITLVVRPTTILVVKPDAAINSAKELAALAKEKPATIPFASTGSGSTTHLALELYQAAAKVKFPACALSRRRAGLDRSPRRPGHRAVCRHAGAAAAHPRRQAQADRRGLGRAQSAVARRGHARRAGVPPHRRRQLVRPIGAGEDAARRGGEAA